MQFDNEQLGQLKQVMQEAIHEEVPGIVTKIVAEAEERIVKRITNSVAEMIEDNIVPQIQELRDDVTRLKTARWRLA
ncbi:MAG: hypothetical protein AAB663_02630 [Patescibacteria group bacterium]